MAECLIFLTACLYIVLWLLVLNVLQKVVLFLKNFSYNVKTNKQDITTYK